MAHSGYMLSRTAVSVLLSLSLAAGTGLAGAQPYPAGAHARSRPAQTANAGAAKASLNFPPAKGDAVALQCDQLADSPTDPARIGDGVAFNAIQVDQALSACQAAAASGRPRYQFVYGRVLIAAMRYQDAAAQLIQSDRAGDAMASFALARLYQNGVGVQQDANQALVLYSRAADAYARAAASSNQQIADLGRQYFDNVPATPGSAPQRTVASSAKDSSDFWTAIIVGGLAVGAIALLTSGSSDSSSSSAASSCCVSNSSTDFNPFSSTSSSSTSVPDMAPTRPQLYDPRDPTRIVMGDLTDPALATK